MTVHTIPTPANDEAPPIRFSNLIWVVLAIAVLVAAILSGVHWFLNFVHVICGVLWTGIDLFMGFVVGPMLRAMPIPARRAFTARLMPRMVFLMPTLAAITGTAGWFLAVQSGYLKMDYPEFAWVLAALIILGILTVQGMFMLLPINLTLYFEGRKQNPDGARIARLMRWYVWVVGSQGLMQVTMIVIMARFVTGI
jgi:hypothetical protein